MENFRKKSETSALGLDGLILVCQQVQKFEKYSANSQVQKLAFSRCCAYALAEKISSHPIALSEFFCENDLKV